MHGVEVLDQRGRRVGPTLEREAWKIERGHRLGSSDAGTILGQNEYQGPWSVWDRIVLGDWRELEGADIRRGNRQEPNARARFEEVTGLKVEPLSMVHHPDAPELVTDLDGVLFNNLPTEIEWPEQIRASATWSEVIGRARGPGLLELKVPRIPKFFRMKAEGLDRDHLVQTQHHFMVTGCEWGFFGFYTPEYDDILAFPVFRDDDFCRWLFKTELAWIKDHVDARVRPVRPLPPPPRWPDKVPGEATLRDDDEWLERAEFLVLRYYELADAQGQYDETAAHLLELIDFEADDVARHQAGGGVTVKLKESAPSRRVDFGALRAAIQLARSTKNVERLLEIDPDADEWKYTTATKQRTEVSVFAPNPYELQRVEK